MPFLDNNSERTLSKMSTLLFSLKMKFDRTFRRWQCPLFWVNPYLQPKNPEHSDIGFWSKNKVLEMLGQAYICGFDQTSFLLIGLPNGKQKGPDRARSFPAVSNTRKPENFSAKKACPVKAN